MLDPKLLKLATDRIDLDFLDRREASSREFAEVKAKFSARGVLTSSFAQAEIIAAISAEFETRALMIWQILSRVLSGEPLAVSDEIAYELKTIVRDYLMKHCEDLGSQYDSAVSLMRGTSQHLKPIDELRTRAINRVSSEIDMSLHAARKSLAAGASIVNIYQPFGIIQTGSSSSAMFNQYFGETERARVTDALDAAEQAIRAAPDLAESQRTEVNEVIADARKEIQRPSANVARLRGSLVAIATTIQTLGSAASAYQLLKSAAALVGLSLP